MSAGGDFTAADRERLRAAGIDPAEAERQRRLILQGAPKRRLLRPCTLGDGIETLPEAELGALGEVFRAACARGRLVHFIPASGAATRMAKSFADLQAKGEVPDSLAALFRGVKDPDRLPKALLPFHLRQGRPVTPVEEHIREAAALAGPGGEARLHFTVAVDQEEIFAAHMRAVLAELEREGIRAEATLSRQEPSTQTIALDDAGHPVRDAEGNLVMRPGGHGALLGNLERTGAEFAWIRNIDNIPVEKRRAEGRAIRMALAGSLIRLADGRGPEARRPLRVSGMVRNTGEPGGGPFWVEAPGGESLRIVESPEADFENPEQARLYAAAAYFNPNDTVCALRDLEGRPFRLADFVDPDSYLVIRKTQAGKTLRALEWPGLWNGSMAGWETHCREIPLGQFAPVKTAADLLRPEHQGD